MMTTMFSMPVFVSDLDGGPIIIENRSITTTAEGALSARGRLYVVHGPQSALKDADKAVRSKKGDWIAACAAVGCSVELTHIGIYLT